MTATKDAAAQERIHRIAAELFARNGYHGTGMADLSDAVGLGRGALYYHINSKEAVLYAISAHAIDRLIEPSDQIVEEEGSVEDRMRALARVLMRNIAELSNEWTVFFREHIALTGERHADIMRRREHYEGLWTALLSEGTESGEFKDIPPVVTKGILGMFNYSYLWIRPDGPVPPEAIADSFCDVLLHGLCRRGE